MGFRDLLLFYVVTGISLRWIATAAAAGPSSIVIWIGAWLAFYTPLALSVIELSSRYPNEGGLYVWSKRAFGDFSGFMAAWTYWTSNLPYFPAVLYFAASNVLFMRQAEWGHLSGNATFYITFSLMTLVAATLLNIVGLDVGKWLHNIGALAMWIPVVIVIGMGLFAYHRFGSATTFSLHTMIPSVRLNDIIFWSVLTFAFGGCETASFMGEEIKNARRTIPFTPFRCRTDGKFLLHHRHPVCAAGAALERDQQPARPGTGNRQDRRPRGHAWSASIGGFPNCVK